MTNAPQEEMIGKYRVIERIGSGSQGTVYRAHDPRLGRDVALKVLHSYLASPDVIARFRREAQVVASISHPNIAGISGIGEHNGSHFIAYEYASHAASDLIRRGPMDIAHAASISRQTALALEAARVEGVTHHNVKPDNLRLTSLGAGGIVKLIDFDVAHMEGMASNTQAGSQWGTPLYMPPEQWAGERGDTRSDVYSLGAVMYQMLAGRAPFDSDAKNKVAWQTEIARQHNEDAAPPIRSVRPDVSEELEAVIAKCMAKSPTERYQTPGELANALAVSAIPLLSALGDTDVGRVRSVNRDGVVVRAGADAPLGEALIAVADGMGAAGEVASQMALDLLVESLAGASVPDERALMDAFARANAGVREASRKPAYRGMAATLVAGLLAGGEMIIGNVGDSRMYLYRDGNLSRVTRDHSWVGEMVASNMLTEERAANHPRRNALTRALGAASSVNADLTRLPLLRGDRLTLCSDGLHDMVDDKTIAEIMGSESFDLKRAARDLIDLANQAGGTDNITVALARFDEKNLEILDTKDL